MESPQRQSQPPQRTPWAPSLPGTGRNRYHGPTCPPRTGWNVIETFRDGVVVVGTAHIASQSVAEVEATIRERRPARVLVELDEKRFSALKDPEAWQNTDIFQVIRQKKQHVFLLQLYLAAVQARMGRETGVAPGAEMLRAIEVADEVGAEVVLIDRDVSITLKRGFGAMGFWARLRLFWNVWKEVLTPTNAEEEEALDMEKLLQSDAITTMTQEFAAFAPQIKTALIDERDAYMAHHILEQAGRGDLVAVVGAGHLPGIRRRFEAGEAESSREALEAPPPRRITVGKILGYAVPLFIVGVFVWLGVEGRYAELKDVALYWVLVNGGLSALGALLARGHPLSILTAFVAAPITSLNPALAAGWFAGAVEAKLHAPTVADFQAVKQIETMKDFYRNGVVRILLVTALANLGSVAGTWIAGLRVVQALGGS